MRPQVALGGNRGTSSLRGQPEPDQANPAAVEDTEAWHARQVGDRSGQPAATAPKGAAVVVHRAASLVSRPSELCR
jgi:hypothetical protein